MKNKIQWCDSGVNQIGSANDKSSHAKNQDSQETFPRKTSTTEPANAHPSVLGFQQSSPEGSSSRTVSGREEAQQVGTR